MTAFEFSLGTRVVFGLDAVDRIGSLVRELGGQRVFLVTDPGIVRVGHVERTESALTASKLEVRRFDQVRGNPTSADVEACRQALGDWDAEVIVGLGGGSSIDVAKGCNFVRAGGGGMEDYWGVGKGKGQFLPLIAIPTTAGTGSEVQSFALIEQEGTHQKMACGDPQAAPKIALLDPTLTVTQPRLVTACTGLDALVHAVETAVTKKRTPVSRKISAEAFDLIQANLPRVLAEPDNLEARSHMLKGAAYAGIAIEKSMLGAAHSAANPLTAQFDIPHGQAVAVMLPTVVRFNAGDPGTAADYATLARRAGLCPGGASDTEGVDALVALVESLLDLAGLERSLANCGVSPEAVEGLACEAARQWTAQFNPREVTVADFRQLFEKACLTTPS